MEERLEVESDSEQDIIELTEPLNTSLEPKSRSPQQVFDNWPSPDPSSHHPNCRYIKKLARRKDKKRRKNRCFGMAGRPGYTVSIKLLCLPLVILSIYLLCYASPNSIFEKLYPLESGPSIIYGAMSPLKTLMHLGVFARASLTYESNSNGLCFLMVKWGLAFIGIYSIFSFLFSLIIISAFFNEYAAFFFFFFSRAKLRVTKLIKKRKTRFPCKKLN